MRHLFVTLGLATAATVTTGCNDTSFQGSAARNPATAAPVDPGTGVKGADVKTGGKTPVVVGNDHKVEAGSDGKGTETFALDAARGALDLVWIIDNSGSMSDKTAKVRQNFERFMTSAQAKTDLRVILMSLPSAAVPDAAFGDLGITLPEAAKAKGHVQIPLEVGSYNPMAMAAAATCPKAQTTLGDAAGTDATICGKDFRLNGAATATTPEGELRTHFEAPENILAAAGVFLPYFRAGAQRAYVFVSDENSFGFEGQDFADAVRKADPTGAARIFAFRGAKANIDFSTGGPSFPTTDPLKPTCDVAFAGKAYDKALETLGGQMFDICADDWSPQFDSLSATVTQLARNRFELKTAGIKTVTAVEVDGKTVPASAFKLDGAVVTIDQASVPGTAKVVTVHVGT